MAKECWDVKKSMRANNLYFSAFSLYLSFTKDPDLSATLQ